MIQFLWVCRLSLIIVSLVDFDLRNLVSYNRSNISFLLGLLLGQSETNEVKPFDGTYKIDWKFFPWSVMICSFANKLAHNLFKCWSIESWNYFFCVILRPWCLPNIELWTFSITGLVWCSIPFLSSLVRYSLYWWSVLNFHILRIKCDEYCF